MSALDSGHPSGNYTMAKDKKAKTAEKKARVAAKQNKKTIQKDKRVKSKGIDDSDAEDVDLESVLAEYAKKVGFRI